MSPRAWFAVPFVVAACSSASKPDLVQYASCRDCQPFSDEALRPVATYAWVPLTTAWYSECHYDAPNGQDGLIGECHLVENTPSFRCADDRCRLGATTPVHPDPGELNGNAQRTEVMIVKPGPVTVVATLTPRAKGKAPFVQEVPMIAATPDRVQAGCDDESRVFVGLYAGDTELLGVPRELVVQLVGGGRCEQTSSPGGDRVEYRCPFTSATNSVEVKNPDFALTVPLPCPALAARFPTP
jgi:hypothetical protein